MAPRERIMHNLQKFHKSRTSPIPEGPYFHIALPPPQNSNLDEDSQKLFLQKANPSMQGGKYLLLALKVFHKEFRVFPDGQVYQLSIHIADQKVLQHRIYILWLYGNLD